MGLSLAQPGMEGGPGGGMPGEGMLGMPGMDGPGGEMPGGGGNENHDDAIHLVSQFASSAAAGRAAGSAGPGAAHNSPKDVKPSMEAPPGRKFAGSRGAHPPGLSATPPPAMDFGGGMAGSRAMAAAAGQGGAPASLPMGGPGMGMPGMGGGDV